jgi:hypothetical protein
LKHSCLSRYGRLFFSVFQLRAISGHRSVRMLEIYVKVDSISVINDMDFEDNTIYDLLITSQDS